jgi:hypothetical protein
MAKQNTPKWEWFIMAAYYDNDGKLRFADPEYYSWPIKLVIASFRKEGWELARVVPIKAETTEEIKHDKHKMITDFLSNWFKKPRDFVDRTETAGKTYYFKRPKQE